MTNENNTVNYSIEQIEYLVNQTRNTAKQAYDLSSRLQGMMDNAINLKENTDASNNKEVTCEHNPYECDCEYYTTNQFKTYVKNRKGRKYKIQTLCDGFFDVNVTVGTLEYDSLFDHFVVTFKGGAFSFDSAIIKEISIYNKELFSIAFNNKIAEMEFTPYC